MSDARIIEGTVDHSDLQGRIEKQLADVSRRIGLDQVLTLQSAVQILSDIDADVVIAVNKHFVIPVAIAESMREDIASLVGNSVAKHSLHPALLQRLRVPSLDDLYRMITSENDRLLESMDARYRRPNDTSVSLSIAPIDADTKQTGPSEQTRKDAVELRHPQSVRLLQNSEKTSSPTLKNDITTILPQPKPRRASAIPESGNPVRRKNRSDSNANKELSVPRDPPTIESMLSTSYKEWEPRQKYAFIVIAQRAQAMRLVGGIQRICDYFNVDRFKYNYWMQHQHHLLRTLQETEKITEESADAFLLSLPLLREEFSWPDFPTYENGPWNVHIIRQFLSALQERRELSHYGALADAIRHYCIPEETIRFWIKRHGEDIERKAM